MVSIFKRIFRALGFHVHEWGKWETMGDVYMKERCVGRTQVRTCRDCGKLDVHRRYLV